MSHRHSDRDRRRGTNRKRRLHFRLAAIATALLGLTAACTSGPGPVEDARSYDEQISALRASKDQYFRTDPESPIPEAERAAFSGLSYFPIDPAYKVPTYLTPDPTGRPIIIELQTSIDTKRRMRRVGTLGFTLNGTSYTLTAFADVELASMNRLFVPFGDLTNGSETYRGGRYLDLDRTPTGLYDLDFNRAYHPFCVFNTNYECPVPPHENRLPTAIRAGEKLGAH
jgi:uncharacterized protein